MDWATFWATFSKKHLVPLLADLALAVILLDLRSIFLFFLSHNLPRLHHSIVEMASRTDVAFCRPQIYCPRFNVHTYIRRFPTKLFGLNFNCLSRVYSNIKKHWSIFWKRMVSKEFSYLFLPGVDVMITIFCDFPQFSAKKLAFFQKPTLWSIFFKIWLCLESKTPIFRKIFLRKYFKNHNIGPRLKATKLGRR
jgi:hypothetical protein